MKKIMLGNEASARGLYEAGCRLVSSYPGTPSTEITEEAAGYNEIYTEWAPNEKVALETAIGASVAGGRAFCAMKHVGLNVAADPLFIGAYVGVGGGLVIGVADDPGMHSSQNEQDSRHYARAAKLPMVEPSDSEECLQMMKAAFDLSERFDTPVIYRTATRVAHSQSRVTLDERTEHELVPYEKNPAKRVMMPANAVRRHVTVEQRLDDLREYAETSPLNIVTLNEGSDIGIITAGGSYNYAVEVFGKTASYFKLGMSWPLPSRSLCDFAARFSRVIVIEEGDPVIEEHCRILGLKVDGKNILPLTGEYSQQLLREKLLGELPHAISFGEPVPPRPPVLCPGCPHRGIFYVLKKMQLYVSGDIGCYTLGAVIPLSAIDTTFCMGASVSALHGFNKIRPDSAEKSVAVIGDSTFMHSGITGLINMTYNTGVSTVIILDNRITGMTGHQQNPGSGYTIKGEEVQPLSLIALCAGAGVESEHIRVVDPFDLAEVERVLGEELASDCTSVIIAKRPCALLKYVTHPGALKVDTAKCIGCRACMKIGCPAISMDGGRAVIDDTLCNGCGLCAGLCRREAIIR